MDLKQLQNLRDIPAVRQFGVLIGLALAVAAGLGVFFWTQKPAMVPLFASLDDKDAAAITESLSAANVPFRLEASGAIAVPESMAREVRLKLAAQGLPAGERSEVDNLMANPGFGVSQFMESARYQHALEQELQQTITTLKPVRNARVHLALAKPSAFARDRGPASASVLVELLPGRSLDPDQVAAVVHLVASSIPELEPERVTVVDQFGRLLTTNSSMGQMAETATQFEQTRRLEESYISRVRDLLEPLTGPGRVSTQVALDMDFAVVEEARESFTPDDKKIRSEQVNEEMSTTPNTQTAGVPGATSNQPPNTNASQVAANASATNATSPTSQTKSETRNFELDRTVSHTRNPAGRIRRLTVAVLVDNVPKSDGKGGTQMVPLTPEELTRLETLVKQAVGFDEKRGDALSVLNAAFAPTVVDTDAEGAPFWQNPMVREFARYGVGLLAMLVLIFSVVRPAVRNLVGERVPALANENADGAGESVDAEGNPVLEDNGESTPDVIERKLALVRTAAQQDPKRVAQVVKNWVATGAAS